MLPLTKKLPNNNVLRTATLRGFSGGWNVIDDDMNLAYNYSTRAKNVAFTSDGVARVRYGTELFADCRAFKADPNATVIDQTYYNSSIVVVFSSGQIMRILGDGTVTSLDSSLWGETTFVSFTPFNGHLTLDNGSDKPLDIDQNFIVEYQQDAGTNTNINTPIGRYACACQRYKIVAGDPLEPNRVHISARDAYGTWFGDPPPNDATRVDVGSILPNSGPIRGLVSFRDKLIVLFAEGCVVGTLGIYDDDGNHTPDFNDSIQEFGGISQRAASSHGDDAALLDLVGVSSLRRTVFSTQLKPERTSDFISPEITALLENLSIEATEDRAFSVYDAKEGRYMLFIPDNNILTNTTETRCFVYAYRPALKLSAWQEWRGWNWTSACRSLEGNIFFSTAEGKIWRLGNRDHPIYTDFIDTISPIDSGDVDVDGVPIIFDWELPWSDFRNRALVKNSKHLALDTRGDGEFTAIMYVDNHEESPTLSIDFSGGEQGGFGNGPQPFGGGRNTSYKKKFAWPAKFEICKMRFMGSATGPLAFVSITFYYQLGSVNR